MLRTTFSAAPARSPSRAVLRGPLVRTSRLRRSHIIKLAVILFVVTIPFKAAMLFDIPTLAFGMVPVYAGLLALALTFAFFLLDRRMPKIIWPKPIRYMAGFGLLVGLSILQSALIPVEIANTSERKLWSFSITQSAYVLATIVAAFVLFEVFTAFPEFIWPALRAHFATSLFVCLWGLYQAACFYRGWQYPAIFNNNYHYAQLYMETLGGLIRISSTAPEPSWLAVYLVSVIPIAFYSVRYKLRILSSKLDVAVLVLNVGILLLTTSLTGFLGLILIALILAKRGELSKVLGIGLAVAVLALTIALLSLFSKDIDSFVRTSGFLERATNISGGSDLSVSERGDSMTAAMDIFFHHPIIGVGEGNSAFYYGRIYAVGPRVLAEHGVAGAFLLGAFVLLAWRSKSPSSMPSRARWLQESLRISLLVTFVVILMTMAELTHYEFWLSAAVALALSSSVPAKAAGKEPVPAAVAGTRSGLRRGLAVPGAVRRVINPSRRSS